MLPRERERECDQLNTALPFHLIQEKMADLQTPKQSGSLSTPEAPKRETIPRPHHYQTGPAGLFSPLPSTREDIQDHRDLKVSLPLPAHSPPYRSINIAPQSLVESSEPDFEPPLTYLGPPIGFSAKIVQHCTPLGVTTTSVYGSLMAPRPRLFMQCNDRVCLTCRPVLVCLFK